MKPLKAVSTHNDDVLDETTAPDTEIVYVDISGVDGVTGINSKETMLFSAAPSRARRRVRHGDVIVSTVRTYLRAIARIRDPEENLIVSTGFAVVRPRSQLAPDFLGYLLSASHFVEQVIARSTGISYPAINASELVGIPVSLPPLPEQIAIATFLDRETAKIDALVAEQQRLIELLKEKRQAVISHAVTKGLNPSAPVKPSGIEWLGDVPEHWEVTKIGYVGRVTRGTGYQNVEEVDEAEDAIQMIRISDFNDFDPVWVKNASTLDAYKVDSTDLLIAGTGASAGITMRVTQEMAGMIHSYNAPRIRCLQIEPEFLYFVLNSQEIKRQEDLLFTGSAQHFLDLPSISKLEVPRCDRDEQKHIVKYLNEQLGKLETLTTEAQRAIDLLQERRTALISAAVTGQIDVRST